MKICIIMSDEEAGYLAKFLRKRYQKGRKVELSTLMLMAAKEAAATEFATQIKHTTGENI